MLENYLQNLKKERKKRKRHLQDFSTFSLELPSRITPLKTTSGNRIAFSDGVNKSLNFNISPPHWIPVRKAQRLQPQHSSACSIGCVGYVNLIPPTGKITLSPGTVPFGILNLVWIPAVFFPCLPCCGSPTYCTTLDCLPLCNNPESHSPSAMCKLLPLWPATGLVYPFKKVGRENAFSQRWRNRCVCPLLPGLDT